MATEDDALKILQSIEKLLKGATALTGNKPTFSSRAQISQKDRADKEARKAFKAVAGGAKEANDSVLGLHKSLIGLNTEVGSTTKSFGALNTQMAKFMTSLQPIQVPEQVDQAKGVDNTLLIKTIGIWGTHTVAAINNVAKILERAPEQVDQAKGAQSWLGKIFGRRASVEQPAVITPTAPTAPENTGQPLQSMIGRMISNFGNASAGAAGFGFALGKLWEAAVQGSVEYLHLSRIGMGSMQNLKDISLYAIEAGMSLKEYTALTKSSITVMSKAGSLENFNKIISAQDQQLASMGIFGIEARQLQANLAQSAASLGVPLADLGTATASQVSMFEELRKTTNMGADEFSKLTEHVAESAEAQKELLGLAPRERMARMNQLMQLQTIGSRLGMTAEASKQLGDALMKQRQSTVKSRFDQSGAALLLGAATGLGAEGNRASELLMKGRQKSGAEDEELTKLLMRLKTAAEQAQARGGYGEQAQFDTLSEMASQSGLSDLMDKAGAAALAKDAGPQAQEAFGKHVDGFGKWVGELTTWSAGLQASIVGPILASLGAGLLAVFRGPIASALGASLSVGGGVGKGIGSMISGTGNLFAQLKNIPSMMAGVGGSISNWAKGIPTIIRQAGTTVAQGSKLIASGFGNIIGGMFKAAGRLPVVGGLISAGMELFTGEISSALNPNGGWFDRLGGIFVAFIGSVPQMIIDALSFVFGDSFMKPIQSVLDVIKAGVAGAINVFARVLVGAVSFLTDLLPDDSALKIMVNASKASLDTAIEANTNTINSLGGFMGTDRKTLKELSDTQAVTAKKATETTKAASKSISIEQSKFDSVMSAGSLTAAGAIQDARALIASPQVQVPKTVTPAAVNTPETPPQTVHNKQQTTESSEVLGTLQAMLQVLRDTLTLEGRQVENSEALIRLSRPSTNFPSAEHVVDRILKR